jgi:hypothetical protein
MGKRIKMTGWKALTGCSYNLDFSWDVELDQGSFQRRSGSQTTNRDQVVAASCHPGRCPLSTIETVPRSQLEETTPTLSNTLQRIILAAKTVCPSAGSVFVFGYESGRYTWYGRHGEVERAQCRCQVMMGSSVLV